MAFCNFGIHSSCSSLNPYSDNMLPCLGSLHPRFYTCSPIVGIDEHLDNSQLASPQVAGHSETSHILSFHHPFLGNEENTSLALQTWLRIKLQSCSLA